MRLHGNFSISLNSLWMLPLSVNKHGGLSFVLVYTFLVALLGAPLLLLEISLAQYSGLTTSRLYRHLCPLLSGILIN